MFRHGPRLCLGSDVGTLTEQYRYDIFGAPTIKDRYGHVRPQSAIGNRFMFTGREWAAASLNTTTSLGFYEYRARAYHPGLGRFMSEDPKLFDGGDYNLFRYCDNDPEDHTDPMGMASLDKILELRELADLSSTYGRAYQSAYSESQGSTATVTGQVQGSRSGDYYKTAPEGPKGLRDSPTSVAISSQNFNQKKERAEVTLQVNAPHGPITEKIYSQESIANDPKQTFLFNAQGKRLGVDVNSSNVRFIGGRSGTILDYAGKDPQHPIPPHSSGYIVNKQGRYNIGLGDFTYRGVPGSFEHHIVVVDGHAVWAEVVGH